MTTTIREGSYISARSGRRLENRNTDFSGFREVDQHEKAAPDVEKTLHQPEKALSAQRVNRGSTADGDVAPAEGVLRRPTPEDAREKGLASAGHESSAQAVEGALIDRILSEHKEQFMDLIRSNQRTVYATVFALLVNKWTLRTLRKMRC